MLRDDNIFTIDENVIALGMSQEEKIKILFQIDHVRRRKFLDVQRKELTA